ncbi:trans-aconitate 2-methyltransferase [Desulfovibrio sp. X2]|uniref:methyltransferase domain-containing protein n=1 Tax=Desulfovibrio sp. X2 TaxID=941449 RepID=UPI000358E1C6|nr:methyltransferase domain-containing protein [Desulfovibrio sp. X2]EPR36299.1 trans-aconitate 2-methyltransferase [Desulfovibrio sp. X2]
MATWDSGQYLKFKNERTRPSIDLTRRIEHPGPKKVLDVGCGPGNSTEVLARAFPGASILGVDSSAEMIASATAAHPELAFRLCDASRDLASLGADFDVVFSNACIQWVPDHPALLRSLMARLAPGGVLAVQIPLTERAPIHRIIRELTTGPKWGPELSGLRLFHTLPTGDYYDILAAMSDELSLWDTTYHHVLDSHAAILQWYRGTGLRPYLAALDEARAREFEQDVHARVAQEYPLQADGKVIFHFPRFFFTARAR